MDNLLLYLLKVSAGITLFYLCYLIFFRKDTFFLRNRIFLVLTLLLPSIIPALKIPFLINSIVPAVKVNGINEITFSETPVVTTMVNTINSDSYDYNGLLICIYFTIAGLLLLKGIISLISTYIIIKNGVVKNNQFPKVILTGNQLPPFSFFPYAVIPDEEYKSGNYADILDHEFAHIRQGHTFDLLLSELFIAFQWFNPFVWLIKRSIMLNHEYLADNVSLSNTSIKEYQYRLLNFKRGLKNISLAHNFNSLIKNRIIMINKKPTLKYAALKNILILPIAAFAIYAFATPEYHNVAPATESLTINQAPEIIQKEIRGTIVSEEGKPLKGVNVANTGNIGNIMSVTSGPDGRFTLSSVPSDSYLIFDFHGYKRLTIKADFKSEMVIKMAKDPDFKEQWSEKQLADAASPPRPLVVLDGVVTEEAPPALMDKLGPEFGTIISIKGKEATDKYGEAGKNGVVEVYSKKKAAELGLKFPFRRSSEDDYPKFKGENYRTFNNWALSQLKYPSEATSKGIQGRVAVSYSIEADGSINNVKLVGKADPLIADEVIRVVQSSPQWDPAVNSEARVTFPNMLSLKFELPDKILYDDVYSMVEKMPVYPGGDSELLKFIATNTKYPESAKAEKIKGRVIVRFIINTMGNPEEVQVIKGVHPLLDEESVRVVSMLSGFEPGMQGGKPVNVWYVVPISFILPEPEPPK
jgi:TonB family protein